jgi:hypothetical protein
VGPCGAPSERERAAALEGSRGGGGKRPREEAEEGAGGAAEGSSASKRPHEAPSAAAAAAAAAAAPKAPHFPGWELCLSKSQQRHYYYHAASKRSAWQDTALPEGWAWAKDREGAPKYYISLVTGERRDSPPS